MTDLPQRTLYFNDFRVQAGVDLLYKAGAVVPLEPRAVRVLRYLAENHDRVVTKEELLEAIWPEVFTTDGVLKRAVSQVRRALGDTAERPEFIATYHGRGYQFIADISSDPHAPEPDSPAAGGARPALQLIQNNSPEAVAGSILPAGDADYNQMVGREAELDMLKAEYRRTLAGDGRPVLIVGEPGVGKTQLARDFAEWAARQGALRLTAKFYDYPASRLAPYEVFLDLLRTALGGIATKQAPGADLSARGLREIAEHDLGILLPEELFNPSGRVLAKGHTGSLVADAAADNFRAVAPISQCFARLSGARPLVIIFDDLQWADEASREVVGYMLRTAQSEPLMIVALAREEEATDAAHPFAAWLRRQANYRSYTSLTLKPLDEQMCRAAIRAVFGGAWSAPDIPDADLKTLCRVTGGNPFFLTEMLRLMVSERVITYGAAERRWQWNGIKDLRLPDTIIMAARDRLDRLSVAARETLECAAVIGDEFRVETLGRVASLEEEEIERHLREGVERGALSERGLSPGEDCRFHHTILRHVLYDHMAHRRRKRLHARAARALEVGYASESDRVAEAISTHYEAAGEAGPTFEWGMRAWRATSGRWNWASATQCVERAHRAFEELERAGEVSRADRLMLLLAMGETYYWVARLKESERRLKEAIELASEPGDRALKAQGFFNLGRTLIALSHYREAVEPTTLARSLYAESKDGEGEALSLIQMGSIQTAMGNYEMAAGLIDEALSLALNEAAIEAVARGMLGWARTLQGNYREGVPLLDRAADYFDGAGDVAHRALLLRRLHWAHLSRGQFELSVALAERARDDYRRIGDVRNESKLDMGIGQARIAQGLYEEGIVLLARARDRFRVIGETHMEAESFWLLGRAHYEMGRIDEAAAMLARSLILVRAVGDRDDEFRVLTDAARMAMEEADFDGALRSAGEAVRIAEELSNRDGLGAALVEQSRALLKLDRVAEAMDAAGRAIKLLDDTESSERWRGYWALALILDRLARIGQLLKREGARCPAPVGESA